MLVDHHLDGDLPRVAEIARALEARGFDGLYSAEAAHDPFLPLMLAAEHTERPVLFTNIAVAFGRSPMDLAQSSDALQRASRGRFVLGLGSQIRPHIENRFSMPWGRPVARMREMVEAIKAIHRTWNQRVPLEFRGQHYRHTLMTPFFDPGPNPHGPPDVWVAGLGPRMTQCAAEVADGLLVHPFHSGSFVREHVASSVEAGLARSGRDRAAFVISATPIVCTGSDEEELEHARAGVRRLLAFYGSTPAYRVALEPHGWGELQTDLNALTKQGRWDDISALISDDMLETLAVVGTPSDIARLLDERYEGTVDRVGLSMPYPVAEDTLAAIMEGFRA